MYNWITVPEIAARLYATPEQVDDVLAALALTTSRAHSTHDDRPRRYSPRVVDLVRRELNSRKTVHDLEEQVAAAKASAAARGETCVTLRGLVRTWNPLTERPITLELVATGPLRQRDGVTYVDCTLGGIAERVIEEHGPRLHAVESEDET